MYRKLLKYILIIFSVNIITLACVDEYLPDLGNKYQNLLVVDGMITNKPGPYTIRLSLSTSVNRPDFIPLEKAKVTISDNAGNSEVLSEGADGNYSTSSDGITGIVGRQYKITIVTANGNTYESSFEELIKPVEIESVYAEIEYREDPAYPYNLAGYQFYIDTKQAEEDSSYLMWRVESTYKYQSDFLINGIFDSFGNNWGSLEPFPKPDSLRTCWKTYLVNHIFVFNTTELATPQIIEFPLNYVTTETKELSIKYSLKVDQLTITDEAYNHWDQVKKQNAEQGGLYNQQPYQIRGNIRNINNSDEAILGYFIVAGLSEKRIFVNRPPSYVPMRYFICDLDQGDFEAFGYIGWTDENTWPLYVTRSSGRYALPQQKCLDCRKHGGTIIKPDFWID